MTLLWDALNHVSVHDTLIRCSECVNHIMGWMFSYQMSKLGNGWCDTGSPFNTRECGYDGGDCCDTSLPLYDCQDPRSPNYQQSSATGIYFPAPTNPLYSEAAVGRSVSVAGVAQNYNNFYEVRVQYGIAMI